MVLAGLFGALGLTAAAAASICHSACGGATRSSRSRSSPTSRSPRRSTSLADGVNLALRSPLAGRRLPVLPRSPRRRCRAGRAGRTDGHLGLRDLADFSWKQLLDLDACTKCGRCHAACPAVASGAPLSPRDLILDLRQQADATWAVLAPGSERRSDRAYGGRRVDGGGRDGSAGARATRLAGARRIGAVAGGLISAETLWSCTTCLACVEACPVGIEHVPTIVGMRRSLVDQGDRRARASRPPSPASPSRATRSASPAAPGRSGRTASPTPIRRRPRARTSTGCGSSATSPRSTSASRRRPASWPASSRPPGVDFGILYEGERNAGNDVRRAGEEGLFELLVEHNVGQLSKARFRRIVTTDPHTLNTLSYEYPQFGGDVRGLALHPAPRRAVPRRATCAVRRPIGRRVTYHDPCYLARYSDVTAAPREVLAAIGAELVEMPRNGANTFCCGAGGGRIWMDDSGLRERPSEQRIREAAALDGVTDFVTACPKDLTMYTAAAKATGHDDRLVVARPHRARGRGDRPALTEDEPRPSSARPRRCRSAREARP